MQPKKIHGVSKPNNPFANRPAPPRVNYEAPVFSPKEPVNPPIFNHHEPDMTKSNPFHIKEKNDEVDDDPYMFDEIKNNPLAQMGYEYSKNKMTKFISDNKGILGNYVFSDKIRSYFNVDNTYLVSKFMLIVFPFKKNKTQLSSYNVQNVEFEDSSINPSENKSFFSKYINLPPSKKETEDLDLYIPFLALLSFVLFSCFSSILNSEEEFSPQNIINDISNCFILSILEVFLTKFGFLIIINFSIDFLDCLALCSYKYVG